MPQVFMPRLSDTMTEGTVSTWTKGVGDRIEKGDVIAEIETDKATMELEAYDAGVLEQILVDVGKTVPISVDPLGSLPTKELANRANAWLVTIDDALKTSEQELGFAQAALV